MKIDGIISLRKFKHEAFRDVVYEWEDEISNLENIPIIELENNKKTYCNIVCKVSEKIERRKCLKWNTNKKIFIAFITILDDIRYILNKNCIPIFLDIGLKQIDYMAFLTKNNSPFVVTCYDFYSEFKKKYTNHSINYMPLMIADIWKNNISKKTIDIIQVGRKNAILHNYALEFVKKYPQYEYVYSDTYGTLGELNYKSTKGRQNISAKDRAKYMKLLAQSKVCLVSSPGIDSPKEWVIGMDFPTPRFYEAAASGCKMIGRYSKKYEFYLQKIDSVVHYINDYNEFETVMMECLNHQRDDNILADFTDNHLTSKWWKQFKNIICNM